MKINLREWLKDMDDNKNLFSLNIVGTHDSVANNVQLSHFSKCQDRSIYEQLNIGVRALDIRVKPHGKRLKMIHGVAKVFVNPSHLAPQMDMQDVLLQCYNFLKKNPSEVIIFQFKNDSNLEMERCFDILYNNYIVENPELWYLENRIPDISEVRGKIVLLRRCDIDENGDYPLGCGIDFSRWVEQDEITPEPLLLETNSVDGASFIIQDRFKYKPVERWQECIKPFLDERKGFDGTYVECYLSTAGGIKGPQNNAKYINAEFMDYPLSNDKYYGIIYTDFPSVDMCRKIISTNYEK